MTEAVKLVEGVHVQLREKLVAGDQKLEFAGADLKLLLNDVGLKRQHLGEAGVPVGFEPGLGRRGDGDDPAVVGRRQPEQVAELSFGRDHLGGSGHQVESELFEALLSLGDVGDGAATDF